MTLPGGESPTDATIAGDAAIVMVDDPGARSRRSRAFVPGTNRLVPYVVAGAIVLAIVVGIAALAGAGGFGGGAGTVEVPSLVGMTRAEAAAKSTAAEVLMRVGSTRTADDPVGLVISQSPAPGDFVHGGDEITVVVSRGPPKVRFGPVANRPLVDVKAALEKLQFVVAEHHEFSESVPAGTVIDTDPKGIQRAPRESTVTLVVSDGPQPVPVPDVSGKSCDEATQLLTAQRLTAACQEVFSDTVAKGLVVDTDPPAGKDALPGSQVVVHVSKGPEIVTVPNVVGMTVDAATSALQAKGFQVDVQNFSPGKAVRAQAPQANAQVPKGTKVTLFL